jgi:hypothetical protein
MTLGVATSIGPTWRVYIAVVRLLTTSTINRLRELIRRAASRLADSAPISS